MTSMALSSFPYTRIRTIEVEAVNKAKEARRQQGQRIVNGDMEALPDQPPL
jgi:hypothetical protein